MRIEPTGWYPLEQFAPVREGWYEVQLVNDETAFAKYGDGTWSEKPPLVFTHWRGLSKDPSKSRDPDTYDGEVAAAEGVRAVWNAFFPGTGESTHKPV